MCSLLEERAECGEAGADFYEPLVTYATKVERNNVTYELMPRVSVVLLFYLKYAHVASAFRCTRRATRTTTELQR